VKRIAISFLLLAVIAFLTTSCGTSDYIKSVSLSANGASAGGSFNLPGVDATVQFTVTANYHSGKTINVTNNSTWTVTTVGCTFVPPNNTCASPLPPYGPTTVPISTTGLMQGIEQICTWVDLPGTNGQPQNPPAWAYTGYYQVVATYRQFTTNPVGVGVGVAESNSPTGGCGPA
jgi:hypothetical protein